jgi:uncharacterized protein YggU (UPF0235/DUF167 family)
VSAPARPWLLRPDGLTVSVRLTPKGGRVAIDGCEALSDGRMVLKARVSAAPEDGRANTALRSLLADTCGVPASRVSLTGGATSRVKTWRIDGDATTLAAALDRAVGALQPGKPG